VLDACRQYGFNGPQPLSLPSIIALMDEMALCNREERDVFLDCVLFLDHELLTLYLIDRERATKAK
jgi:hypothetical protein